MSLRRDDPARGGVCSIDALAPEFVIATDEADLDPWLDSWDELARSSGRPYSTPAWLLPWWAHLRPEGAQMHVVLAIDAGELHAVAPFFVHPGRWGRRDLRLLGSGVSHGLAPVLSRNGTDDLAEPLARALAEAEPSLVSFELVEEGSPWPGTLSEGWPSRVRPTRVRTGSLPLQAMDIAGVDHDTWIAGRSRNFREQLRRANRRLDEAGGSVSMAITDEERVAAISSFGRLHASRWEQRGGSNIASPQVEEMLLAALPGLPPSRLRIAVVTIAEQVCAVQIFLAVGGHVASWNGGWDDRYGELRLGYLALMRGIQDARERGDMLLDLGGGDALYKQRLADEAAAGSLVSEVFMPVTARYPQVMTAITGARARRRARTLASSLPDPMENALRRVIRGTRHAS